MKEGPVTGGTRGSSFVKVSRDPSQYDFQSNLGEESVLNHTGPESPTSMAANFPLINMPAPGDPFSVVTRSDASAAFFLLGPFFGVHAPGWCPGVCCIQEPG